MNKEDIQRCLQRWQQLKAQYGDQATNVPEFNQLTKFIRYIQMQTMQRQQNQGQANARNSMPFQQQGQQPQMHQQQNLQQGGLQQQNLQHMPQGQQNQPYMPNNNGLGSTTGSNSNLGTPLAGQASVGAPQPGLVGANALSPQNMGQVPSMLPQNMAPGGPMLQNGAVGVEGESPFTAQQLQLLKQQSQACKMLFKNAGGFPLIPQTVIDQATNERMAFTQNPQQNVAAPISQAPQQNLQAVLQSPQVLFPQPPTPAAAKPRVPTMAALLQAGTPQQIVGTPHNVPQDKKQPSRPSRSKSGTNTPKTAPLPDPTKIQPVTRPPEVPVIFDEFSKEHDLTDQFVVPISKPNSQVDTFVLPKIFENDSDSIAFNSLYTPQCKVKLPSLQPYGIDVDDIMTSRESYILLQIDAKINGLMDQISRETDEDEKRELQIELAQLELLPYQKDVRGRVLSQLWFSKSLLPNSHPNFLAKFADLSIENIIATEELYKQQLYSLVQAQNRKHQETVARVLAYNSNKRDRLMARKEKLERFAIKVNSFHAQTAKEEQKKLERMAKQRLQALKLNDEEAYLKLLDHTKDTRITHLLSQTNQFLDSLAQAVQTQQRESIQRSKNVPTTPEEEVDEEKREKVDYYQVAHRIKEEVHRQPSILVGGQLKEYQLKGLQWMVSLYNNHLNGILADEMGLGKTIQTISLITYLIEMKQVSGPFLVIVPLSTLTNWNMEFEKWAPSVRKITYKGTPVQRKVMQHDIRQGNFQVLLTTFEYIIKDKGLLSKVKWVHMIIDEGHRMKNSNSKLSETLTQFYHTDYRLILTGTPLQNNLPELWALLNFVLPKIFNSVKSFDEWFNTPFANTGGQDKIELSEEETLLVIRRLHKVLRPFLLRRLKKDVEKDLPNKVERVLKCKMSSLQSKLYRMMLKFNALIAGESLTGNRPSTIKNANNQLMQLRKICNHPFVYEEVETLINPNSETNDNIWRVAGKFELLDRILPKFKQTGHRVLIFFQMTQIMDIMEDFLRLRNMKYLRLDGGTKSDDRSTLLKLFNAPDSEYFCFLLSTRAGGLGLNLQSADTVIIFDSDWNPHQDLQAQDRAHRIGQKNEVRILRLITEDSIEEMILKRAVKKLEIDGKVIQAGKFDNKSTSEEQEALLRALLEKEEERRQNTSDESEELDDDELNQIIARNDNELIVFRDLDAQRMQQTRDSFYLSRLFTDQELPEIYQRDPQSIYKTDEQVIEEYGRGNRERKTAVYDDNLTEEEWLRRIEGIASDESDDDLVVRKKGRPRKDDKRKLYDDDQPNKRSKSETPSARAKKARAGRPRTKTVSNRSTPAVDTLTPEDRLTLQNNMEIIYGKMLDYKESDRKLSDLFMVKPSKRLYPDYYVLIKHPLAFDTMKKRISTKAYMTIREFLEDVHLIFSNARIYNEEGSLVYKDALTLENLAVAVYKDLYALEGEEEWARTLDFRKFDEDHQLKPIVLEGVAVKQPTAVAPMEAVPSFTTDDADDLTPLFDLKGLEHDI